MSARLAFIVTEDWFYHCPGHSPGSLVYYSPALRFASIRTKVLPLGDETTFLPGHGPGSSVGEERVSNPFLR